MPRKRKEQSDNFKKAFPTAMRKLMEEKGTTQNELADYLQKTRQSVSYYCDGSSSPDWETIVKIADFFDVSTDYLLGRTEDPSRQPCAADELGLSVDALKWLRGINGIGTSSASLASDLSTMIEKTSFQLLIYNLVDYSKALTAENIFGNTWERYFPANCVMSPDVALRHIEEFNLEIANYKKNIYYDGAINRYLEALSLMHGERMTSTTKLADILKSFEGFVPSELCAHRVNKYTMMLMEDIKGNIYNADNH